MSDLHHCSLLSSLTLKLSFFTLSPLALISSVFNATSTQQKKSAIGTAEQEQELFGSRLAGNREQFWARNSEPATLAEE